MKIIVKNSNLVFQTLKFEEVEIKTPNQNILINEYKDVYIVAQESPLTAGLYAMSIKNPGNPNDVVRYSIKVYKNDGTSINFPISGEFVDVESKNVFKLEESIAASIQKIRVLGTFAGGSVDRNKPMAVAHLWKAKV